jgi:hypothetical protein
MSRSTRVVVLVTALLSSLAVLSQTAGAVTWTNSGGTGFHAAGGPMTFSVGANNLVCSGSTATGTMPMSTTTNTIIAGTVVFSPCTLFGLSTFVHCTHTFNAISLSGGVTLGSSDLTCDARLTASPAASLCHIDSAVLGSYTNPNGSTPGMFTFGASSTGTVTVSNGTMTCPLGTGSAGQTMDTWTIGSVAQSPVIAKD